MVVFIILKIRNIIFVRNIILLFFYFSREFVVVFNWLGCNHILLQPNINNVMKAKYRVSRHTVGADSCRSISITKLRGIFYIFLELDIKYRLPIFAGDLTLTQSPDLAPLHRLNSEKSTLSIKPHNSTTIFSLPYRSNLLDSVDNFCKFFSFVASFNSC